MVDRKVVDNVRSLKGSQKGRLEIYGYGDSIGNSIEKRVK
jgi:hypothetical protein